MPPFDKDIAAIGPIWRELYGGLWHTTHPNRFAAILKSGALEPEPKDISDRDRWGTANGPTNHPFARSIGAISLFDFDNFDSDAFQRRFPNATWREFVPARRVWGCAVWIEIERSALPQFISGRDLLVRWKQGHLGHNILPYLEAAHVGPVTCAAFKRAFLVDLDGCYRMIWKSGATAFSMDD